MQGSDADRVDVGVERMQLVKTNDGSAHPFEVIQGGDKRPFTITTFDEVRGAPLSQVTTYEPWQLDQGFIR